MIKYFQTFFNNIMEFGYYSDSYDQGLMFSIYKSGKNGNQNKYRCTTLSNCSGKLFNTILYNKLQKRHSKSIYLSPAQVGFWKYHRTSDHIFALCSQISKYIKKGKYLYNYITSSTIVLLSYNRHTLTSSKTCIGLKNTIF